MVRGGQWQPHKPYQPQISMLTVNANRTYAFSTVATTDCPESVVMADFNGDGVNDLIFSEVPCSNVGKGPHTVVAKYGSPAGTFGTEQTIYNNAFFVGYLDVLKSTQGTRPDVCFNYWTGAPPNNVSVAPQAISLLSNDTTTGSFPACGTPNLVEGVYVCAPASATANSPVTFSVSSAGPAVMRTAAVWVDGQKLAEQLTHTFSHYSFLDQSFSLDAGTHSVTVFGTAVDNTLQQKTFSLTAGGSGCCAAPPSPGVNICTPANGAYVGSPTQVTVSANIVGALALMKIWVDYTKLYTEPTSTSLNSSLSLAAGYHRFDVFALNAAGTKYQTTTYATIGNGTCAADTGYDVNVCSPIASSIDSSPVRALATAHIVGTLARMEVWVDFVKQYTETNSLSLNTSLPLASGQHALTSSP